MSQYESAGWRAFSAFSNLLLVVMAIAIAVMIYLMASYKPDPWQQMGEQERAEFKRQADLNYRP
jgi:hypothetical protein